MAIDATEMSPGSERDFYSGIHGDGSQYNLDREGDSGEMLFFASDLMQSDSGGLEDISDDSLNTSEVRERDRVTLSNTLANMDTTLRARHDHSYQKSAVAWEIPANSSSTSIPPERLSRYRPGSFDPKRTRDDSTTRRSRSADSRRTVSSSRERGSQAEKHNKNRSTSSEKKQKPWRASGVVRRSVSPAIQNTSESSAIRKPMRSKSLSPSPHDRSKRYLKSRDDIQQEAVEQFREEFTFKPKLVSERLSIGHRHRPDIQTRINEMYESHEKSLQSREKMKRDLERSELVSLLRRYNCINFKLLFIADFVNRENVHFARRYRKAQRQ